jgi:phosphomannomutase
MNDKRKLDPTILREYDIRGVVGESLKVEDVRSIGRAFGSIVVDQMGSELAPTVAVGYDGRLSSVKFSDAMCSGLESAGIGVVNVGCGPTPMLYYATHELSSDAGVMITGSHNPANYNGIKLVLAGKPFFGADIQRLGKRVEIGDFKDGLGSTKKHNLEAKYIRRLLQDFSGEKELRIAWDPGNGSSGEIVTELIKSLPGEHFLINDKIDGNFPAHHPDPTIESNLVQLKDLVIKNSCDLGIGFDGDGDRIGLIDSNGRVLWGDQILILLARDVLKNNPGETIIADVKASTVFFDEIIKAGGKPVMWAAGHSLIKSKMLELNAPLAGEMSGHIFFADKYFGYDDAIYAAIRLLTILSNSDQTLTEMHDKLPKTLNTPELRIDCPEERKFDVIKEIKGRLSTVDNITVYDIDGVRVESKEGWWLVRASNTQAVLVARCESTTEVGLSFLKKQVRFQLAASRVAVPIDLMDC